MTPSTETQRILADAFDDFSARVEATERHEIISACARRTAIQLREAARSASGAEIAADPQGEPSPCGCPVGKCYVHSECSRAECYGVPEVANIACKKTIFPAAPAPAETTAPVQFCCCPFPVRHGAHLWGDHRYYDGCGYRVPETPGPQPVSAETREQKIGALNIFARPEEPARAAGDEAGANGSRGPLITEAQSGDGSNASAPSSPVPTPPDATPERCPTCDSPRPHLHPAMQEGGEVQECRNPWHVSRQPDGADLAIRRIISGQPTTGESGGRILAERREDKWGVVRVEEWPEGLVFWVGGEIKWRSWK